MEFYFAPNSVIASPQRMPYNNRIKINCLKSDMP